MPSQQLPLEDGLLYQNKQNNQLTPLPGASFYQDELKLVTDDVFSYMCSLAMEKCSKKSEKKKASCGGAAMRKRLKENNSTALDDGREMDYSEENQLDSGMDVDEDEDEDEDDQEEEEEDEMNEQDSAHDPQSSSSNHGDPEDDHIQESRAQSSYSSSTISHSTLCYNQTLPATFYDSTSNITSRSCIEQWNTDDFHQVPPTASEPYILDEENHCHQPESLLYSLYPQYSSSSPPTSTCSPYSGGINVGALPDNLLDDISLWEEKKHVQVDCSAELNNESTALASLVNMVPSMIKIGSCRSELTQEIAYRRCITDLDTNTPIWIRQSETYDLKTSGMDYKVDDEYNNLDSRVSLRKRHISGYPDHLENGTANLCNLMMLTSPKRVKL
uniref:Uncharacterized protein n=1 Tax=Ditylenchus dipsaci TaxID=166011 RepID=A0A915CST4_9BILA